MLVPSIYAFKGQGVAACISSPSLVAGVKCGKVFYSLPQPEFHALFNNVALVHMLSTPSHGGRAVTRSLATRRTRVQFRDNDVM